MPFSFSTFLSFFRIYRSFLVLCDTGSVCIYCTVMSADVPLHTVLDIDLYLAAAEYEAVTEQLQICSCWHYLHSPFQTERGYQTPGGLDVMFKHEAPCAGLSKLSMKVCLHYTMDGYSMNAR